MGRPSKYTVARFEIILEEIRNGSPREAACAKAHVHFVTLTRWAKEHKTVSEELELADAEAERRMVEAVKKSIQQGDGNLALKWLERRRPERWKPKSEINVGNLSDDELLKQTADSLGVPVGVLAALLAGEETNGQPDA